MTPRLLAVAVLLGCSGADPLAPDNATRIDLGPRFAAAWQAVEQCSGLTGQRDAVKLFSVPGDFVMLGGRRVLAYWSPASNAIYVASFYVTSDPLLRHEALHALIYSGEHPAAYFVAKCGSLVGAGE